MNEKQKKHCSFRSIWEPSEPNIADHPNPGARFSPQTSLKSQIPNQNPPIRNLFTFQLSPVGMGRRRRFRNHSHGRHDHRRNPKRKTVATTLLHIATLFAPRMFPRGGTTDVGTVPGNTFTHFCTEFFHESGPRTSENSEISSTRKTRQDLGDCCWLDFDLTRSLSLLFFFLVWVRIHTFTSEGASVCVKEARKQAKAVKTKSDVSDRSRRGAFGVMKNRKLVRIWFRSLFLGPYWYFFYVLKTLVFEEAWME